jgi:hypothetical protein
MNLKNKMNTFAFIKFLLLVQFVFAQNSTVTYNMNAIECIHNKSIMIPFYTYIYSSYINCFGDNCNVTEMFVPIYEETYILL